MDYNKFNIRILKACLQELKDKTSGLKQELIARLQNHDPEHVKEILERQLSLHENSGDVADISTNDAVGEDAVAKLQGEVTELKNTVTMLVQQLQAVFTGPRGDVSLPRVISSHDNQAAVPLSLPVAEVEETSAVTQIAQSQEREHDTVTARSNAIVANSCEAVVARVQAPESSINSNAAPVLPPIANASVINAPVVHTALNNNIHTPICHEGRVHNITALPSIYAHRSELSRAESGTVLGSQVEVRDMIRIMPEFCPGKGLSSGMFIDRINQLMGVYGWNEDMVLYAIYDQLKGPARQWMSAMPIFHQWSDFVAAFLADFPCEMNLAELHMTMMRTGMNRNESYADYYYRMLSLGRSGSMDDMVIITYIINGLYDESVKQIVSAMHFHRCSDLLRTLTNMHMRERRTINTYVPLQPNTENAMRSHKPNQVIPSGPICFRCRERGHVSRNCPKAPLRSERINNIENAADEEESSVDNATINTIAAKQKCHDLRKSIIIGKEPALKCEALIDSGSGKSLIKKSVASNSGCEKIECHEKLLGFAGGKLWCTEKIKTDIQIDDVTYPAELLVVDDNEMKYDVIIGFDILAQGTVLIDKGVCTVMPIDYEKLDIGRNVCSEVIQELHKLLYTFAHCFGENLYELGKSKRFEMEITLISEKPIVRKPYPIPIPKQEIVEDIVQQLLDLGIIRPSNSSYASPIVLVKKTERGKQIMCRLS